MEQTIVTNLMDGREKSYGLAPEEAVVAAFEEFEGSGEALVQAMPPRSHPRFKEGRRGFACGDWVAFKR